MSEELHRPTREEVANLLTQAIRAASHGGIEIPEPLCRNIVKFRDGLLEPKQRRLP